MSWGVVASLGGTLVLLAWLSRRGGTRNVLLCVAAVFAFFAYGPLVNLLMGEQAYRGIVADELVPAALGFLLAVAGLTAADLLLPQRKDIPNPGGAERTYELLPFLLVGLTCYALVQLVTVGPAMFAVDKLSRIELAGPWHYPYLLAEMFAAATFFIARRVGFYRTLYWINACVYVAYCLVAAERDFLFVGLAVVVHLHLFDPAVRSRRMVALGAAGVGLAALLAALREGLSFGLAQVLNQGSIPFVDTYMRAAVPDRYPFRHGETYLDALLGLLPHAFYTPREPGLSQWLVDLYVPGAEAGGYGFSLTAEAYVDFGTAGIPVVFLLTGLALRWVVNRAGRSDWATYLSIVAVIAVLLALRGDSAQVVRILLYGTVLFALLHVLSTRAGTPAATRLGVRQGDSISSRT
jgi:O-antigen polysaccharide polymerase Wzy-like protein